VGHDQHLEEICQQGCSAVREAIASMEQGDNFDTLSDLGLEERQKLLESLKEVMAVYDKP
jgi:hypothetical protein